MNNATDAEYKKHAGNGNFKRNATRGYLINILDKR